MWVKEGKMKWEYQPTKTINKTIPYILLPDATLLNSFLILLSPNPPSSSLSLSASSYPLLASWLFLIIFSSLQLDLTFCLMSHHVLRSHQIGEALFFLSCSLCSASKWTQPVLDFKTYQNALLAIAQCILPLIDHILATSITWIMLVRQLELGFKCYKYKSDVFPLIQTKKTSHGVNLVNKDEEPRVDKFGRFALAWPFNFALAVAARETTYHIWVPIQRFWRTHFLYLFPERHFGAVFEKLQIRRRHSVRINTC